ncbi:MAG: hypothetical protein KKD44_23805 [Proteobacteria bacterium]|nr:hypothetical protein [Pseudomonadota bacterium]
MKRMILIALALLLLASSQSFAKLNKATSESDGFWHNHSTNQIVTFTGFIVFDMDEFNKGNIRLHALPEYSRVRLLDDVMTDVLIERMDPAKMAELINLGAPVKQPLMGNNLEYISMCVSVKVKCLKIKDRPDPAFRFVSFEKFNIPKE